VTRGGTDAERIAIPAADGRALDVWVRGPEDGAALVFHHGTPMCGMPFVGFARETEARAVRLVSCSRPGYAWSDRQGGRSVAACAADVASILDHLGIETCSTIGWSGGGPHALATAAMLPDRVRSCATMAGVAPYGVEGIDFLAGMGEDNVEEFGLALSDPDALAPWIERVAEQMVTSTPETVHEAFDSLLSDVDRRAMSGELAAYFVDADRVAFERGTWGWFDDDIAFTRPWGFDLSSIRVPVTVWQGEQDRFVPFAHGEWLAAHIPGVRAMLLPDHGHLSLSVASFGRILDDVLERGS
jgi:pimeloyl-ACP methyl ester carboxylesterase